MSETPPLFSWTPEAQERLERAPAGFMRDCTKALIQKHAEKVSATTITLEIANEGIEQARGFMEDAMKTGNLKEIIASLTGSGSAKS
ncbi:MAG: PCP reductase family protein [Nitrospira sp.]